MTTTPRTDAWPTISRLRDWLDACSSASRETHILARVLKLSEEVGEVAEAVIGAHGLNPRRGDSHTRQDVENELCDVIITAMVALATITPGMAEQVFAQRIAAVAERSLDGAR